MLINPMEEQVSNAADAAQNRDNKAVDPARPVRATWWIDLLLFLILCGVALPVRWEYAHGDLWSDEADYAMASTQGFQANRWDISNNPVDRSTLPDKPDRLVYYRHYHAPMTVYCLAAARHWDLSDQSLRLPFILAGALSVGMVYLCAVVLFKQQREIGIGCALLVVVTPPVIRMASHAVPWSLIILELLLLLWTQIHYAQNCRPGWLIGTGAALGLLFVTSEVFFLALPAAAGAFALALWREIKPQAERRQPQEGELYPQPVERIGILKEGRRSLLWGLGGAALCFVTLALLFWPAGLFGHALLMLKHYASMSHSEAFPVVVGQEVYSVAPKWAYLYWYWNEYRPFTLAYALGIPALLLLLIYRKATAGTGALVLLTAMLLLGAHRAHIVGKEYLAHCLPFLTLIGGYFFFLFTRPAPWFRLISVAGMIVLGCRLTLWVQRVPLPGMDLRAQIPRWTPAAHYLSGQWHPGDRLIIGPQPAVVPRWYLSQLAHLPVTENQTTQLTLHNPKPALLEQLSQGRYRYLAICSAFIDSPELDTRTVKLLKMWRIVWKSDERGTGPSRLTIYECPPIPPSESSPDSLSDRHP